MSGPKSKRSKAATCEDWDEDTQSTLPGSKTTANVAVKRASVQPDSPARPLKNSHEGSDSGYSSKAATDASMSSHRRNPSDLPKVDTAVAERERKPYSYPVASAQPTRSTSVHVKGKATKPEPPSSNTKFVHKKGECWTCDQFGFHVKAEDLPRSATAAPPSPKAVRTSTPKVKDEETVRPTARRMSSNRERPVSWYGPAPMHQGVPVQYTLPVIYGSPIYEPTPPNYGYQYQSSPVAPMTPYTYDTVYFEHGPPSVEYHQPPPLSRRRSSRVREQPTYEQKPVKPPKTVEMVSSKERPSTVVSHKPTKSQEDRIMMPPPPKPSIDNVSQTRPRPDRSQTYHTTRRQSQYLEDEDIPDLSALNLKDDRPASPRRPPSSYRAPATNEVTDRPRGPGKSRSYTQGSVTAEVATAPKQSLPRRTTMGSIPMEQKEAEAEEYQRRKGSLMANDLTAENLRKVPRHSTHRSEAGSVTSRISHHSSSKGSSSGRGRGSKTNININGVIVSIPEDYSEQLPLKIDLGGVTISAGPKEKEALDTIKELKRIERAPSTASRASRRSVASGSGVSSNIIRKDRDDYYASDISREQSRRPSQLEEDARDAMRSTGQSSRQHSRTGSSARGSADYGRSIRYSQDYDVNQDYAVYGA